MFTEGEITLLSAEALAKRRRVKLDSDGAIVYSDAGQEYIGVTEFGVADATNVSVRDKKDAGTHEMTAAGAIAIGTVFYGAVDGKISAVPSGNPLGFTVEAATADGDLIECYLDDNIAVGIAGKTFEAVADNKTLDAEDVGKVMYVTVDAKTITLPSTVIGYEYTIMNGAASGTVLVTVSPAAADKIAGADLAGVDDKDRLNTKATAILGDYIEIAGDGVAGWYVNKEVGIWAAEG